MLQGFLIPLHFAGTVGWCLGVMGKALIDFSVRFGVPWLAVVVVGSLILCEGY